MKLVSHTAACRIDQHVHTWLDLGSVEIGAHTLLGGR